MVTKETDPSEAYQTLSNIISNALDETCPYKTNYKMNKTVINQPWFTAGLRVSCKKKRKLYKKSLKHPNQLTHYRNYRNIYNRLIKRAIKLLKSNYYSSQLKDDDIKGSWRILREIISKTNTKDTMPDKLKLVNHSKFATSIKNDSLIADFLNNYFSSVVPLEGHAQM